ncbi:MAG: hypothetical protein WBP73_04765, partial [Terriglobales bacterium]
ERNLIISGLYEERRRLRADLKRASRLGVMPLANALASLRRSAYKLASKIRRRSPNDAGER